MGNGTGVMRLRNTLAHADGGVRPPALHVVVPVGGEECFSEACFSGAEGSGAMWGDVCTVLGCGVRISSVLTFPPTRQGDFPTKILSQATMASEVVHTPMSTKGK